MGYYFDEPKKYDFYDKKKEKYRKENDKDKLYQKTSLGKILERLLWDSKVGVIDYKNYKGKRETLENKTDARVLYVDPKSLPVDPRTRTLGLYDPNNHTIYIANNLSPREENFVYHHEQAHAKGIYNEDMADQYAASIVGYNLREKHKSGYSLAA